MGEGSGLDEAALSPASVRTLGGAVIIQGHTQGRWVMDCTHTDQARGGGGGQTKRGISRELARLTGVITFATLCFLSYPMTGGRGFV